MTAKNTSVKCRSGLVQSRGRSAEKNLRAEKYYAVGSEVLVLQALFPQRTGPMRVSEKTPSRDCLKSSWNALDGEFSVVGKGETGLLRAVLYP
jgi:hypothetical protein